MRGVGEAWVEYLLLGLALGSGIGAYGKRWPDNAGIAGVVALRLWVPHYVIT